MTVIASRQFITIESLVVQPAASDVDGGL